MLSRTSCAGLYIGSLGPHTAEVVQLQRKYGDWQIDGVNPNGQELQFFEYVEAVKLTGDVNVPAGQVPTCSYLILESTVDEVCIVTVWPKSSNLVKVGCFVERHNVSASFTIWGYVSYSISQILAQV